MLLIVDDDAVLQSFTGYKEVYNEVDVLEEG